MISCAISKSPLIVGGRGWRFVLGFKAFCDLLAPNSRRVEDFFALYVMRKTKENGRFFAAWSGLERLIVNLADSDHVYVRPSSESLVLVRRLYKMTMALFRQYVTKKRSSTWCLSHGRSPREGSAPAPDRLRLPQLELVAGSEPTFHALNRLEGSVGGSG